MTQMLLGFFILIISIILLMKEKSKYELVYFVDSENNISIPVCIRWGNQEIDPTRK